MVEAVRDNNVSRIQQTLRSRGAGQVLVVKPGQLQNLKGLESLSRLPALHQELTDLIGSRLGIKVTDILCDAEGKLAILAANPSFMERIRNGNGDLEVLGHTVVWEMENEQSGKLYLLKNNNNIRLTSPILITDRVIKNAEILRQAGQVMVSGKFPDPSINPGPALQEIMDLNFPNVIRDPAVEAFNYYYYFSTRGKGTLEECGRTILTLIEMMEKDYDLHPPLGIDVNAGPVDPKVVWDAVKELKGVNVMGKEFRAGPYQVKIGSKLVETDDSILELTLEVADQVKVFSGKELPSIPLTLVIGKEQIKLEAHYPPGSGSHVIINFDMNNINEINVSAKRKERSSLFPPYYNYDIDYEFSIDNFNSRLLIRPLIRLINESRASEAFKKLMSSLTFIFSGASEEAIAYKNQIDSELKNIEGFTGSLPDPSAKEAINSALDRITATLKPLKINWELAESIDAYIKKIEGLKQIIRAFEDIN